MDNEKIFLNQESIDNFVLLLKRDKFRNKIQDLKLEYCFKDESISNDYIYLALINIKKSQRNKGYGSAILSEIIKYADGNKIEIKLYVSGIYGSSLERLKEFYLKHGFKTKNNFDKNYMFYRPSKNIKK